MQKFIVGLIFFIAFLVQYPAHAGSLPTFKPGSVLLDDETDGAFKEWILQIFRAAGLNQYQPQIYVIVSPEVNAAASVGGNILIFSEFIIKCDTAEQFLGVMAHEVGHIAGGHVSRFDSAMNQAMVPAAAAVILGGALALASGSTAPLEAALAGGSHVFERGMLHFSRTQESSADQAALNYLEKLRWPAEGLSLFLEKIQKMYGSNARIDPYSVTHPLTPDRIQSIHDYMRRCVHKHRSLSPAIEARYQRIRAKLIGFLDPQRALSMFNSSDQSIQARYARAIALYRIGQFSQALTQVNNLITSYPNDPYFHELKGQILFENGDIDGSVPALRKAHALKPHSPLIKIMLAHALLESKSPSGPGEAVKILVPLTQKHPQNYPMAWRLLAIAYGKDHQLGEAALALAEEALLQENFGVATSQANRAISLLKNNPKALVRAKDLLSQIKNKSG